MSLRIIPTMTQSERNDEVSRLLLRYDDNENDLALLLARRDEIVNGLELLASSLKRNEPFRTPDWMRPGRALEDEIRDLPTLLHDIEKAKADKQQMEGRLKAAGRERFIRS